MLDQAFDALKTYDWGTDPKVLAADRRRGRDDARRRGGAEGAGDAAGRGAGELGLARREGLCLPQADGRRHGGVGAGAGGACWPTRTIRTWRALRWSGFPRRKRRKALRDALSKVANGLKIGVIGSLGSRGDAASVTELAALVGDSDAAVSRAAALALGDIRTGEAANAVASAKPSHDDANAAVTDARLACAEALLSCGQEGRSVGALPVAGGRESAEARPAGGDSRPAGDCGEEGIKRS